jgi:hypothetical protein
MPVVATPELGIPFPFDTTPEELNDFRDKAEALLNTVEELESHGLQVEVTDSDRLESHMAVSTGVLPAAKDITPGAIKHVNAILSEFDREVLDVHRRLRNYVTNKLVIDSANDDPRTRLKALELLGKVSGVGLFSERIDVNITQRTVKDIETELRKTLELYDGEYAVVESEKPVAIAEIDLDTELGTDSGPSPTS